MKYKAAVFGASTGGPKALRVILKALKKELNLPIIISQRIPPGLFAESLSEGLNNITELNVRVFKEMEQLNVNDVLVVPGGFNLSYINKELTLIQDSDDPNTAPDIGKTLEACQNFFQGPIISVILTGISMNVTFLKCSLELIKNNEGHIIVQSPESSFITDLPEKVINSKLYDKIIELPDIANNIMKLHN